MSVEEKIVQMKFDNGQFESGVKTTLGTLGNLKQGLKLEGAADALTGISGAIGRFSYNGMSEGIDTIAGRFSNLGIMGVTALTNITNSAINAGKQLVKSLTIDPVASGFAEYEQGLDSIQTILANTASAGSTIDDVNASLSTMNKYANQTKYSYGDMTKAMGLFTANGVALDSSVVGIKGLYNLVAMTGGSAEKASGAAYQLSQALATGSLKLEDFNSLVTAGIAGPDFQKQLQMTAEKYGTNVDALIEKNGSFKMSLTEGWVTSDVLLETLSQYTGDLSAESLMAQGYTADQAASIVKLGATALESATKLKTYTQMMDMLKSNVVTGWSQSFKLIIGDIGQASDLWTMIGNTVGGILGSSADARNAMLSFWSTYGGRDALLRGVTDAFKLLMTIVTPIQEAFKEIFPPANADTLVDLTVKIADFIQGLRVSGTTLDNIKRTAKGAFAIFDIVRIIITKVIEALFPLTGTLSKAGEGILAFTAPIGDFIIALDSALKTATSFSDFLTTFGTAIGIPAPIIEQLIQIFSTLHEAFDSIIQVFNQPISIGDKFKAAFAIITDTFGSVSAILEDPEGMFGALNDAIDKVGATFTSVAAIFTSNIPFADKLSTAFTAVKDTFDGFVASGSDAVSTGSKGFSDFFGGITFSIQPLSDALTWIGDRLTTFKDGVALLFSKLQPVFTAIKEFVQPIIDSVKAVFEGSDASSTAEGLQTLLGGGVIVAIIAGLKTLMDSFGGLASGINGILESVKRVFDGIRQSLELWQQNLQAKTLLILAGAVVMLTGSIVVLSAIDPSKVATGVAAIGALLAELFTSMGVFQKMMGNGNFKTITTVVTAMIGLSAAVLILSFAFEKLAKLSWEEIAKGSVAIAVLLAELAAASLLISKSSGNMTKAALGITIFSLSLLVLVEVVKRIGDINPDQLTQGLIGIGVLMAEIALFMVAVSQSNMTLGTGISLLALAGAIMILTGVVTTFSAMTPDALTVGLVALGGILLAIAGFLALTGDAKNVIATAIGVTLLAAAMKILEGVIVTFSSMSWEELAKGGAGLAGVLGIIAGAMWAMPKDMLLTAVSLVVVSAAIMLLTDSLLKMATMSWEDFGKSMAILAGSLLIIAGAMYLMTAALPGAAALVVVAVALAILVPVLLVLGAMSLPALGIALLALAGVFVVLGLAGLVLAPVIPIILLLAASLVLIGIGCLAAGMGISAFSVGLASLAVTGAAGGAVIIGIVTQLIALIPMIAQKIGEGIVSFAKSIGDGAIQIATSVGQVINAILDTIIQLGPKIVNTVFDLLVLLLTKMQESIPLMVDSGLKLIQGILKGIADNIQGIVETVGDIIIAFVDGISAKLPAIIQSGVDLILSFINGLSDAIDNNTQAVMDAMDKLINSLIDAALLVLDQAPAKFETYGNKIMDSGFVKGIKDKIEDIKTWFQELPGKVGGWISEKVSDLLDAGKNLITGFIKGITDNFTLAHLKEVAGNIGSTALTAICGVLGIQSPSVEFGKVGKNSVLGFANSLSKFAGLAGTAAAGVGMTALNALSATASKISDAITGSIDASPTIRPILDLSNVEAAAGQLNGLLGSGQTISVSGTASMASGLAGQLSLTATNNQNESGNQSGIDYDRLGQTVADYMRSVYVDSADGLVMKVDNRVFARVVREVI